MDDRVFIEGLELAPTIGTDGWERAVKQPVRIDIEVETDCHPAGAADDLKKALDYRALTEVVSRLVENSSFQLLEALAEAIATTVLSSFPTACAARVRVGKPTAVPKVETVGVVIHRRREEEHA